MQERINRELELLSKRALLREPRVLFKHGAKFEIDGKSYLNFSSNDYLNLTQNNQLKEQASKALRDYGTATASARLLSGTSDLHAQLENDFAEFMDAEAAVLFSSGYLANIGLLSSLASRNDVIFADKSVHASLLDGCILSRAKLHRYKHNDISHLESLIKKEQVCRATDSQFFIITDAIFSMDGDKANLPDLVELSERYSAQLIIDEAHAAGIFGEKAQGLYSVALTNKLPISANLVRSATFSKAFASYGGIVVCSKEMQKLLYSKARSFIFNTSLPTHVVAVSLASLKLIRESVLWNGNEISPFSATFGRQLLSQAKYFADELSWRGVKPLCRESQIIPVLVGDSRKALEISDELFKKGIFAPAIRPPTVPDGEARIRFSITLGMSQEELAWAAETISAAFSSS